VLADRYGLPLSTSSLVARDAYVAGADCILSAVAGAEAHLGRALEVDPEYEPDGHQWEMLTVSYARQAR
jgi:hypothetical protein